MNPSNIQDLITVAKADKSLTQPWANYGIKKLQEAIAMFNMAKQTTNMKPPEGMPMRDDGVPPPRAAGCTCPGPGVIDKACPIHGA